jgi:hypothetical protein
VADTYAVATICRPHAVAGTCRCARPGTRRAGDGAPGACTAATREAAAILADGEQSSDPDARAGALANVSRPNRSDAGAGRKSSDVATGRGANVSGGTTTGTK